MKCTLTNQDIENCFLALSQWAIPGSVPYTTRLRLIRNHRKLTAAFNEKDNIRIRLAHSHVKDGSKPPSGANGATVLTPEEHLKFQPEYRKLMADTQEVEIHPVEMFSSREHHITLDPEHALDLDILEDAGREMPTNVQSALLDIVLFEPGHEMIKKSISESGKIGA